MHVNQSVERFIGILQERKPLDSKKDLDRYNAVYSGYYNWIWTNKDKTILKEVLRTALKLQEEGNTIMQNPEVRRIIRNAMGHKKLKALATEILEPKKKIRVPKCVAKLCKKVRNKLPKLPTGLSIKLVRR